MTSLKNESEAIRVDLHQSGRLKTDLADEVVDLTATRDLEKTICDQKKIVVDDYIDANEKAVALYQVCIDRLIDWLVLIIACSKSLNSL